MKVETETIQTGNIELTINTSQYEIRYGCGVQALTGPVSLKKLR
jgi:hypothetical protein